MLGQDSYHAKRQAALRVCGDEAKKMQYYMLRADYDGVGERCLAHVWFAPPSCDDRGLSRSGRFDGNDDDAPTQPIASFPSTTTVEGLHEPRTTHESFATQESAARTVPQQLLNTKRTLTPSYERLQQSIRPAHP